MELLLTSVIGKLGEMRKNCATQTRLHTSEKEAKLQHEIGKQAEEIETELIKIKCHLSGEDYYRIRGSRYVENNDWLRAVSSEVHRINDAIDTSTEFERDCTSYCWSSNKMRSLHQLHEVLDDIQNELERIRVDEISTDHRRYGPFGETTSIMYDIGVVGLEDDKETILDLLLSSQGTPRRAVVTIVGMGGIGKTTLAQIVFNDQRQVHTSFPLVLLFI